MLTCQTRNTDALATTQVKLLQFHIIRLEFSASSPIFFRSLVLSPPAIPISLRKGAIEAAGNPLGLSGYNSYIVMIRTVPIIFDWLNL